MISQLVRRVTRLAATQAAARRSSICSGCGGPAPGRNMMQFVGVDGTLLHGACGSCGLALDHMGKPLCPEPCTPEERWVTPKRYHADTYAVFLKM